jgi:hypothetical protein
MAAEAKYRWLRAVVWAAGAILCCAVVGFFGYRWLDRHVRSGEQLHVLSVEFANCVSRNEGLSDDELIEAFVRDVEADGRLVIKDKRGRLVDLRGTPLVLSIERNGSLVEIEVRSVGPDGLAHTGDDLHMRRSASAARPGAVLPSDESPHAETPD